MTAPPPTDRIAAARKWLESRFPGVAFDLRPASADASFRRYFRIGFADARPSLILMDAPPDKEDCRPFVAVSRLLVDAGVNAPRAVYSF